MVLREISLAKNNLITVDEFRDLYTGDKTMLKVADVFELYDRRKASRMLMDFDDLLVNAYQLLESDDMVRKKYREIFRHLLVDEFQDTNPIQMEILTLLLPSDNGNDSSFWICGDDAQSRYTGLQGHLLATFSISNRCFQNQSRSSLISIIVRPPRFFVPVRISSVTTKNRFKRRLKQKTLQGMTLSFLNHRLRKQRP